MADVVVHQTLKYGIIGCFLQLGRNRGVDIEPLGVGVIPILFNHMLAHHLANVGCIEHDVGAMVAGGYGFVFRVFVLFSGYLAKLQHTAQHDVSSCLSALWRADWVEQRRRFGQAGNNGHLAER